MLFRSHAVLLAAGRRTVHAMVRSPQPSYAGVVGGTLAATLDAPHDWSVGVRGGRSALERPAILLAAAAFGLFTLALLARAFVVGRGPWGNLFEFSVAFAWSIVGGYLWLATRYPIRSIGFLPIGVASALALYAASLPSDVRPLLPALNNAPLLTIHVGMAVLAYGITARSAIEAVRLAREDGHKVGLFRPATLWPFPEEAASQAAQRVKAILVVEMNLGQLALEVERAARGASEVIGVFQVDGEPIPPGAILERIRTVFSPARCSGLVQ